MLKLPKRMSSGQYLDLDNLTVDDVEIEDINTSLNYIYRFTGHHKDREPLTVAQHTVMVMRLAEIYFPGETDVLFDCLLHDMPEAYYSDVATPAKRKFGDAFKQFCLSVDAVVYEKLWIIPEPFTEEVHTKRKICDGMALDIERRSMWNSQVGKELWPTAHKNGMSMNDKIGMFEEIQAQRHYDLASLYKNMING